MEILTLEVKMNGKASSNIALYQKSVLDTLEQLKTKDLITDEDFSSAEQVVKVCKEQEKCLEVAKTSAQDQSKSISEVFAAIENAKSIFRDTRLVLERQIKTEKLNRKEAIINAAVKTYWERHDKITTRYKLDVKMQVTAISQAFTDATKGKKNIDSMQKAVDQTLDNEITHLENIASKKFSNLQIIRGRNDLILFPDADALSDMQPDELMVEIEKREAEHAQQVKIQKEKAEKEAEEKIRRESEKQDTPDPKPMEKTTGQPEPSEPEAKSLQEPNAFEKQQGFPEVANYADLPAAGDHTGESQSVVSTGQAKFPAFRIDLNGSWFFRDSIEGAKRKAAILRDQFGDSVSLAKL